MYQEFYKGHELLGFPLFALLFFVVMFAGVVFTAYLRHRKDGRYDALAQLPLSDEPQSNARAAARAAGDIDG